MRELFVTSTSLSCRSRPERPSSVRAAPCQLPRRGSFFSRRSSDCGKTVRPTGWGSPALPCVCFCGFMARWKRFWPRRKPGNSCCTWKPGSGRFVLSKRRPPFPPTPRSLPQLPGPCRRRRCPCPPPPLRKHRNQPRRYSPPRMGPTSRSTIPPESTLTPKRPFCKPRRGRKPTARRF